MAEAKIPAGKAVELKIAPEPKQTDTGKPAPSTQQQFSTIKRLEEDLIRLGVFDDKGASRMWLSGLTGARCYVELTEMQAEHVLGEMTRMKSEEMARKTAEPSNNERLF
jgi:hypothetical protein